jgi:hypothetical protein
VTRAKKTLQAWVALGLLAALVATNLALLIIVRTGGPLIGIVFYAVLLVVVGRGRPRDYRAAMVGGLAGLAVHAMEVALAGWPACPIGIALNLILSAALAPMAWWASRRGR